MAEDPRIVAAREASKSVGWISHQRAQDPTEFVAMLDAVRQIEAAAAQRAEPDEGELCRIGQEAFYACAGSFTQSLAAAVRAVLAARPVGGETAKPIRTLPNPCSVCGLPIGRGETFVGTGDGSMRDGGSFAHQVCYHRQRADTAIADYEKLRDNYDALDQIKRAAEASLTAANEELSRANLLLEITADGDRKETQLLSTANARIAELEAELASTNTWIEKSEESEGVTIDERDALHQFASDTYRNVVGVIPEWSNQFSLNDAADHIKETVDALRASLAARAQGVTVLDLANAMWKVFQGTTPHHHTQDWCEDLAAEILLQIAIPSPTQDAERGLGQNVQKLYKNYLRLTIQWSGTCVAVNNATSHAVYAPTLDAAIAAAAGLGEGGAE